MQYFIGIDGGGTKSRLIISDETLNKKSIYIGNSINIFSVGTEKCFSALKDLIDTSLNKEKIDVSKVQRICIAGAGLAREYELKEFNNFFRTHYPSMETIFTTDIRALMVGALKDKAGICLIAGTGSVCMGQDSNKNIVRAGGLGWRLGDEGSASFIAQEAIKRSIKSFEQRDLDTNMLNPLLDFFNLNSINEAVKYFHSSSLDKATVSSAASIVTEYAMNNDPLALDILKISANELFKLVLSVHNRLPRVTKREIVTAGGVFEHDEIVNNFFDEEINKYNLALVNKSNLLERIPIKTNALDGALYIAMENLQ
jgi:N-acetylglucosamine kinase-like BadF-type ATPase